METAISTNEHENVQDKSVQAQKQVLGWLICQIFFRFTQCAP